MIFIDIEQSYAQYSAVGGDKRQKYTKQAIQGSAGLFYKHFRELNNNGMTILLTTHYMEEAAALCDRIGIMEAGQLIEEGTFGQLQDKYGKGLMIKQFGDRWEYDFFPTVQEAEHHLAHLEDKTGVMVRESNLEDIFVELTGRQLD